MARDDDIADNLIPGSLKRSRSYHADYGTKTYKQIKELAAGNPPDQKARQMNTADEKAYRTEGPVAEEGEGAALMNNLRPFNQKLGSVSRRWEEKDFDTALAEVEAMLEAWPGNGHLLVLWASLVQLQDDPKHSLEEAKEALHQATELDKTSPAAAIELGHFLDAVEDNPQAASKVFAEGVAAARQLLVEALVGQAKSLLQLEKKEDARHCLLEVLQLMHSEPAGRRNRQTEMGPVAEQVEELLNELFASRPA